MEDLKFKCYVCVYSTDNKTKMTKHKHTEKHKKLIEKKRSKFNEEVISKCPHGFITMSELNELRKNKLLKIYNYKEMPKPLNNQVYEKYKNDLNLQVINDIFFIEEYDKLGNLKFTYFRFILP